MALKLFLTLLLLVGLTFAAPSFEDETEDPLNEDEMLDEVIDDADNDDDQDDEDEADGMEETPGAKASKKPKYTQLFGHGVYCVCKKGAFSSAAKGDEFDMDEAADEVEQNAVAKVKAGKVSSALKKALARMKQAIKGHFKTLNLGCHCTKNKLVIKMLVYINKQHQLGIYYKKLLMRKALFYQRKFIARLLKYVRAIEKQSKKPGSKGKKWDYDL